MRIAHLTPAYFSSQSVLGGGERYVYYLAQALHAVGCTDQCIFAIGEQEQQFDYFGVKVEVLKNTSSMNNPMDRFSAGIRDRLKGFDLVHVHQVLTTFGAFSVAVAKSIGLRVVGTDHGGGEEPLMLSGGGLRLLDGLASVSKYAESLVDKYYGGPKIILRGPVDTNFFCPSDSPRSVKSVIAVSRILPHKGLDTIIKTLPKELPLTVVGKVYDESYHSRLVEMAKGKLVQFVYEPTDAKLLHLYREAGLFVQASKDRDINGRAIRKPELLGLTTLEAMACGLPVLVSGAGALPELANDPRFSRVFNTEDELSEMLDEFSKGAWPQSGVTYLAREAAVKNHGMNAVGHALKSFYGSLFIDRLE